MLALTRFTSAVIAAGVVLALGGCAAVSTSVAKRNLDVQTKISTAVFVDAVKNSQRTVDGDAAILGEPTSATIEAGCQGTLRARISIVGQRAQAYQ